MIKSSVGVQDRLIGKHTKHAAMKALRLFLHPKNKSTVPKILLNLCLKRTNYGWYLENLTSTLNYAPIASK